MENITKITDACLPNINDIRLRDIQEKLGCANIVLVDIDPRPHARINRCHANVQRQVQWYGGEKIEGYYLAFSKSSNKWTAIKHSVWNRDGEIIDVTPVDDERTQNVFLWGNKELYTSVYFDGYILQKDKTVTLEQTI